MPASGLVSVYAESEIRKSSGSDPTPCSVLLEWTEGGGSSVLYNATTTTAGFGLNRTAPGTGGEGVFFRSEAGLVTSRLAPGTHQFTVRYSAFTGATCLFRNTKLVVVPMP